MNYLNSKLLNPFTRQASAAIASILRVPVDITTVGRASLRVMRHRSALSAEDLLIPIMLENQNIGVIALYAVTDEQKKILAENRSVYTEFLKLLAELLAAKVECTLCTEQPAGLEKTGHPSDPGLVFEDILGNSQELIRCIEIAKKISGSRSSVLISGESGTGKEMFARAIHNAGSRSNKNFVAINCSAIPDALLESELFGYEGGSFTGAKKEGRSGKFEAANGGTLFLDEVGDMPIQLQAKLLRVLQERTVLHLGSSRPIPVDVRIIAATNQDLEELISEKRFRKDLYYRLHVIPICIPPLRERKSDIPMVARYLLSKQCLLLNKNITQLAPTVLDLFLKYNWPGNVRELENVIEYAVNMESGTVISDQSLPSYLTADHTEPVSETVPVPSALPSRQDSIKDRSRALEQKELYDALCIFGRSTIGKKQCAKYLNISLSTLYRKLRQYGLG